MYALRAECLEKLNRKQARAPSLQRVQSAPGTHALGSQDALAAWEAAAKVSDGDAAAEAAARAEALRAALVAAAAPAAA